jgi:hypothetical protein
MGCRERHLIGFRQRAAENDVHFLFIIGFGNMLVRPLELHKILRRRRLFSFFQCATENDVSFALLRMFYLFCSAQWAEFLA